MKINEEKPQGVLHHRAAAANYQLRRYFPSDQFNGFIEQFWLVNWQLAENRDHLQQNLPDPNFHLVISHGHVKLLGPVSKSYGYRMAGAGRIIGVKFECGALTELLAAPIASYVDQELAANSVFGDDIDALCLPLLGIEDDATIVSRLQAYLVAFVPPVSDHKLAAQRLVALIKQNADIYSVEQLASAAQLSVRAVQRLCASYVGLSPKWLIRKYRLARALEELEQQNVSILDIVAKLDYVDQSHLIRDFKQMLAVTPSRYLKQG